MGLPAEVVCDGCRPDQRQSGLSPETPLISRDIRGIGGTPLARHKYAFLGGHSARVPSLLAMQKVEVRIPSAASLEEEPSCSRSLARQATWVVADRGS